MPESLHIGPRKEMDAAALLVEFLKPGAWIPPDTRGGSRSSRHFLRPFCGTSTARCWLSFWITSAPFRHPHQPLRVRRECRGN